MAVKTHALFYMREDGEGTNIVYKLYTFFVWCNALALPLQHFCTKPNCIDYHETNA